MRDFLKANYFSKWVFIFLILAIFVRFYNFREFLFFTADNGRDIQQVQQIAQGNLTLIGPTSGLQGFYLGPFWYYLGVPGYLLAQGSPYGEALWLIALASLAVPLFLMIGKSLFPDRPNWAWLTFLLLAFVPGSIWGTIFVLSPMVTLPLMAGVLLSFWRARHSRWWLMIGFFLLGLVLQAEFAYGIFFVPVIYVLIAWIRQRFSLLDYVLGGLAISVTLLPQMMFELRHQFIMTKFLFQGLTTTADEKMNWLEFLVQRIGQLFGSFNSLLLGKIQGTFLLGLALAICFGLALRYVWRNQTFLKKSAEQVYRWQLLTIFAIIPYVGFLLWRGNHSNFFDYYLTPHFIFLVPLVILGIQKLPSIITQFFRNHQKIDQARLQIIQTVLIALILSIAWLNYHSAIISLDNQAGMQSIETAIVKVLAWQETDRQLVVSQEGSFSSSMMTFTPNYLTAQYDYMTAWQTEKQGLPIPYTQVLPEQAVVYAVLEPDREYPEIRFTPWYTKITTGRILIRREKVGVLTLETWMKPDFAEQYGFQAYQVTPQESFGW